MYQQEPINQTKDQAPLYQDNQHFEVVNEQQSDNLLSTKIVKIGSILLFIGTFFATLFLLSDIISGAVYYNYYSDDNVLVPSPHNTPGETFIKVILMLINLFLLTTSGVFGIISTRRETNSKYSLLYVTFLGFGMIVFFTEILFLNIVFYTTGYSLLQHYSRGAIFMPFLICFTLLSCVGFAFCGFCLVAGIVRYRFKEYNI